MTSSHSTPAPCQWFSRLATALDRRSAPRLALLFLGAVLARGRRTVTSWIRAAGLSDQFRPCTQQIALANVHAYRVWIGTHEWLIAGVVRPSESPFFPLARVGPVCRRDFDKSLRPSGTH